MVSSGRIEQPQGGFHSPLPKMVQERQDLQLIAPQGKVPPDKVDPHYLVAMAARALGLAIRPGTGRGHGSTEDFGLWNDGDIGDRTTGERRFPILEAFASLCIWKSTAQVTAVSLQKDDKQRLICLTIAENSEVDDKVIAHVKNIWKILKNLSDQYAKDRGGKLGDGKWKGESPKVPKGVGKTHKQILTRSAYIFSMEKYNKRIKKWWENLHDFAHQFRVMASGETTGTMKKFHVGVKLLGKALSILQSSDSVKSDEDWRGIGSHMDAAIACLQPLLDHESLCESWASEYKGESKNPFRLRRALEKLTSQHSHLQCLIRFSNSPHLRYAFEYSMIVRTVPASRCRVLLPASASDWKPVIESVCDGNNFDSDFLENESLALSNAYPETTQECCIHCECSLVVFLETKHNDSWDNVPAFGFLGVSKLSCYSCHSWMGEFNKLGGRRYTTKGTHGKCYWPWGLPVLGDDPALDTRLAATFAETVRFEYIKCHRASGKLRTLTDSADASLKSANADLEDDVADLILRYSKEFDEF